MFFTSADVAVKYPARSCPVYFRERRSGRFYFDFALHLSINGYLESGCGLLESICRRWKRRVSKEGEKDEAREGPRKSRGKGEDLSLILRLKLNTGKISAVRTRVVTWRVRSKELEGKRRREWEEKELIEKRVIGLARERLPSSRFQTIPDGHFSHRRRLLSPL